uniref:Uncharacterized protein n=1 Tax=Anguilla anguilla TaxID=7936 RepID=A0A0E9W367_ANGAN
MSHGQLYQYVCKSGMVKLQNFPLLTSFLLRSVKYMQFII